MSYSPRENTVPYRILTFAAIGMGVGFGTCSLGAIGASGQSKLTPYLIGAGATLFFTSLVVILLTGLYLVVAAIVKSFKK